MRKLLPLIITCILFSSFTIKSDVANTPSLYNTALKDSVLNISYSWEQLATMKPKEAEKILGKKMTLREKLALKIAQGKLKKALKSNEEGKSSKGQTAMILGIIGIACIVIPYGILASIPLGILAIVLGSQAKRENKNDSKAQTGIILGIVTLGLVGLAIILVAIWLASWGWY
jgi:hypothetical protein